MPFFKIKKCHPMEVSILRQPILFGFRKIWLFVLCFLLESVLYFFILSFLPTGECKDIVGNCAQYKKNCKKNGHWKNWSNKYCASTCGSCKGQTVWKWRSEFTMAFILVSIKLANLSGTLCLQSLMNYNANQKISFPAGFIISITCGYIMPISLSKEY